MKKLGVYHWKIGKNQKNKNPHAVRIQHVTALRKVRKL